MSAEPALPFEPAQSGVSLLPGTNRNAQPRHVAPPVELDDEADVGAGPALVDAVGLAPPCPPVPPALEPNSPLESVPPHAENGIVATIAQKSQTSFIRIFISLLFLLLMITRLQSALRAAMRVGASCGRHPRNHRVPFLSHGLASDVAQLFGGTRPCAATIAHASS